MAFLSARLFYAVWSAIILSLQPIAMQYVTNANQPIVVFFDLRTSDMFAYQQEIDGKLLTFRSNTDNTVFDLQTNTRWNIANGTAVDGYYQGKALSTVAVPADLFPYFQIKPYPIAWLSIWQRFDTNWYISIAEYGYGNIQEDIHFPPLYPLLINLFTPFFGDPFIAGLVISHLATLYALKLLTDVFNEWQTNASTNEALFYLLIFPTSFYLFSAYTESLFLVVSLLALRAMRKGLWAWSGFWIFCAVLTRLQGIALLIPLIYLISRDMTTLRKLHPWAGTSIASLGPLFYIFLRANVPSSSVIPFAEPDLHARLVAPWETYFYAIRFLLAGHFTYIDVLNWSSTTVFIFLLIYGWRKIPLEYNLYALSSLIILLTRVVDTQPLMSMSRYGLTLFPVFYSLTLIGDRPWTRRLITYTLIALNLFLSAQFFGWGWVA